LNNSKDLKFQNAKANSISNTEAQINDFISDRTSPPHNVWRLPKPSADYTASFKNKH
jgi:hypothetical protein